MATAVRQQLGVRKIVALILGPACAGATAADGGHHETGPSKMALATILEPIAGGRAGVAHRWPAHRSTPGANGDETDNHVPNRCCARTMHGHRPTSPHRMCCAPCHHPFAHTRRRGRNARRTRKTIVILCIAWCEHLSNQMRLNPAGVCRVQGRTAQAAHTCRCASCYVTNRWGNASEPQTVVCCATHSEARVHLLSCVVSFSPFSKGTCVPTTQEQVPNRWHRLSR